MGVVITQAQAVTDVAGVFAALVILGAVGIALHGSSDGSNIASSTGLIVSAERSSHQGELSMPHISRRDWLTTSAAFFAAFPLMTTRSFAQELRPLKFAVGLKAMGPPVINTVIGEILGYNAAEGFT